MRLHTVKCEVHRHSKQTKEVLFKALGSSIDFFPTASQLLPKTAESRFHLSGSTRRQQKRLFMANGDVSDASPPRRGLHLRSSSRPPTSFSAEFRNQSYPRQPSTPPKVSRSEHPREHAGTSVRPRRTSETFDGQEYENTQGDVSDASPPRRRRRTDQLTYPDSQRTAASDRDYLGRNDNQPRRPPREGNQPEANELLADNVSIRSTAILSRNYDPGRKGRSSLSTTGARPLSTNLRAPPNRFGIRPGPRWDGVHRSNGFEERLEAMQSMRRDVEVEGYRASVADL